MQHIKNIEEANRLFRQKKSKRIQAENEYRLRQEQEERERLAAIDEIRKETST